MTTETAAVLEHAHALVAQLDRVEVPRVALTGDVEGGPAAGKPTEGIPQTHIRTLVRFFERGADRDAFDAMLEKLPELDAAEPKTHVAPLAYYATLQRVIREFLAAHALDLDALRHVLAWAARLARRHQPVVDRPERPARFARGGERGGGREAHGDRRPAGPRGRRDRDRGGRGGRGDEGSLRDVRPVRETTIGDLLGNALTADPAAAEKPEAKSGRHKGVLTLTGARKGKAWLATTTDSAEVPCAGVPAFPKPDPGDTCRAIITFADGIPESAVFKGWV